MTLRALAARVGVLTEYTSYRGERIEVRDEVLAAVLAACGVDPALDEQRALADYDERTRAQPAVVVAWNGVVPADAPGRDDLPETLPLGYHHHAGALIISAPWRAAAITRPRCGVYAPTYALATSRRGDVGDLAALRQLFDWVHHHGADTVLTLPLLATFPDVASPYSPISRLFWNELHLPIDGPPLDRPPFAGAPATASTRLIDYPSAFDRAHAALRHEAATLTPVRRAALDDYLRESPSTLDYARFRAMGERFGRDWRRWPDQPRDLDRSSVDMHAYAQWRVHEELLALRDHVSSRDGLLGLDLPLGTHPDGFDAWSRGQLFARDISVGAPPDMFFMSGQNWGFAPQLVHEAIASGHEYFIDCVRTHLRHSSLLRIDHVMQFRRLYWVPDGFAATEGAYVTYPFEHYLAILCLESHLAGVPIVGENLGVVPAEVDAELEAHGLLGTWIAFGAIDGARDGRPIDGPAPWALAAVNTHDMPTFRGFVDGADLRVRFDLGLIDRDTLAWLQGERDDDVRAAAAQLHDEGWLDEAAVDDPPAVYRGLLRSLAASAAPIVLANLEDLWDETEQQNVPGTTVEQPNWRRLTRYRIDELDEVPAVGATLAEARRLR
ncbi:MAG: 4-alpha-glucanotransferase [Acidimicrobiales bacterium]